MINEKEILISGKSYTKRDFAQIYPEQIDLIKSLTNKWNPEESNESDPGVVLIKSNAFIGDKINYNIDKNILESFMPSATQETSMRNLCEMNGYYPKYYRAAETTITLMYTGSKNSDGKDILGTKGYFILPAYTTQFSDVDNTVIFSLINENIKITANDKNQKITANIIQGKFVDLTLNNDTNIIQLSNLDDNNRIYLPNIYIAENDNGLVIYNVSEDNTDKTRFSKVYNLNVVKPNSYVYKFGFDSSKNAPYLEFPSDIASLIDSGLHIKYLITDGSNGNISSKILTNILNKTTYNIEGVLDDETVNTIDIKTCLNITNLSGTVNGRDKETIDEAYNSFKKIVGTFNTLVTCRDYSNYIYNTEINSLPLVSNIQVSDRRNDINYSNNVITYDDLGSHKISMADSTKITAFDLCLYPLNSYKEIDTKESYINSFKPISDNDLYTVRTIISPDNDDNVACIAHDFKDLNKKDIYLIKNYYTLNAKIATQEKVNTFEQKDIINNIETNLFKNFNARKVDYGFEIPYDSILKVIENSDKRIKAVSLADPILTTKVMYKDGTEALYYNTAVSHSPYIDIITKNILNGKAPLFKFNADFDYDFGQLSVAGSDLIYKNLTKLDTNLIIDTTKKSLTGGYSLETTLGENQVIQIMAPNLTVERPFVAGVYYRFESKGQAASMQKNINRKLVADDKLYLYYTSNNIDHYIIYTADKIIEDGIENNVTEPIIFSPNFELKAVKDSDGHKKIIQNQEVKMYGMTSTDELDKKVFVKSIITNASLNGQPLNCYWIMNNETNTLFTTTNYKDIILGENEYFIWTNNDYTDLNILGSGTKLSLSEAPVSDWTNTNPLISPESIANKGLEAFSELSWQRKKLSDTLNLNIEQMDIYTFTEGDTVIFDFADKTVNQLDSKTFKTIQGSFRYRLNGTNEFITVSDHILISTTSESLEEQYKWKVKTRLDINTGPNKPQVLKKIVDTTYKSVKTDNITLYYLDETLQEQSKLLEGTESLNTYLMLNSNIIQPGSSNIDLKVTYINSDGTISSSYDLSGYYYKKENVYLNDITNPTYIYLNENNMYKANIDDKFFNTNDNFGMSLPVSKLYKDNADLEYQMFMVYWDKQNDEQLTLSIDDSSSTGSNLVLLNCNDRDAVTQIQLTPGMNIVRILFNANKNIILNIKSDKLAATSSVSVSKIKLATDLNESLNLTAEQFKNLIDNIIDTTLVKSNAAIQYSKFNLLYEPKDSDIIDIEDLSSPEALWSSNNIANRFTLPEIDFNTSSIEVVRSSRK